MNKHFLAVVIVIAAVLLPLTSIEAEVPQMMSYQGRMSDSLGILVTDTIELTFTLYDSSSGGNVVWSETQSSVEVVEGIFSVQLGSVIPLTVTTFSSSSLWLSISVAGAARELTPRTQILSSPFAFRAGVAEQIDGSGAVLNYISDADIASGSVDTLNLQTGLKTYEIVSNTIGNFFRVYCIVDGPGVQFPDILFINLLVNGVEVDDIYVDSIPKSYFFDVSFLRKGTSQCWVSKHPDSEVGVNLDIDTSLPIEITISASMGGTGSYSASVQGFFLVHDLP